jgi:hypothetical protein
MTHFWNYRHQVRSKLNYLNVIESRKTKGSKQDSQNQLTIPEREVLILLVLIIII